MFPENIALIFFITKLTLLDDKAAKVNINT